MSFVALLYTICLLLPTRLKWDNVQHAFKVSIGEAKYTEIVDGGLLGPDEQLHVLIEFKARHLSHSTGKAGLIQQGLAMPTWIAATLNIKNSNGPTIPVIDSPIKRYV